MKNDQNTSIYSQSNIFQNTTLQIYQRSDIDLINCCTYPQMTTIQRISATIRGYTH